MEISKFPEILGELNMHKQCVPGSFFSTHALESGNEANGKIMCLPLALNMCVAANLNRAELLYSRKIWQALNLDEIMPNESFIW